VSGKCLPLVIFDMRAGDLAPVRHVTMSKRQLRKFERDVVNRGYHGDASDMEGVDMGMVRDQLRTCGLTLGDELKARRLCVQELAMPICQEPWRSSVQDMNAYNASQAATRDRAIYEKERTESYTNGRIQTGLVVSEHSAEVVKLVPFGKQNLKT